MAKQEEPDEIKVSDNSDRSESSPTIPQTNRQKHRRLITLDHSRVSFGAKQFSSFGSEEELEKISPDQ